jgi:hypothetical protein
MWGIFQSVFNDYIKGILARYARYNEIALTTPIGFDGATASQQRQVYTPQIDSDCLIFGAGVDFTNVNVTVKVTDVASGYVWNPTTAAPIHSLAGAAAQVMPIILLTCPFFMSRQSKLQMDFTNSAASLTTGGNITWRGVKLLN